jgi:hypothetical protein
MAWKIAALIAGLVKNGLRRLLGLVWAYPWPLACLALAFVTWGLWNGKADAIAQRDRARTALTQEQAARKVDRAGWNRQVADAIAAKVAAEQQSQEIATDAQVSHDALVADNAGLRRYIASRRLRAGSGSRDATSPADDVGAEVPSRAADETVVADEIDIRTCDGNFTYALAAHEWAHSLISAGLAAPAE